jgi:SAM-dependent methyltransferase
MAITATTQALQPVGNPAAITQEQRRSIGADRAILAPSARGRIGPRFYRLGMDDAELRRRYGQVFDAVADEYDRARPTYPDQLVEAACRQGALGACDRVVEVGCGTGHLTAALLARGLRVDAVEPGANMLRLAALRVGDDASVRFHGARFENAELPEGAFAAVFSATAFHWVDPAIGWTRAATLLRPRGMLALIQYCDVWDERTAAAWEAFLAALGKVAPDIAAGLPRPREANTILAGAQERRDNISEVWSWIGRHELAVPEGARLFDDVRITTVPVFTEQTAEQLNAQLRTTSLYARIAPERREQLEAENERIVEHFEGAIRWSELAVLVTAHRAS